MESQFHKGKKKKINSKPYWRTSAAQQLWSHTNYSVFPSFQKALGASTEAVFPSFNLLCITDKFPELHGITFLRTLMVRKQAALVLIMRVSERENHSVPVSTPVSGVLHLGPKDWTSESICLYLPNYLQHSRAVSIIFIPRDVFPHMFPIL